MSSFVQLLSAFSLRLQSYLGVMYFFAGKTERVKSGKYCGVKPHEGVVVAPGSKTKHYTRYMRVTTTQQI